MIKQLKKYRMLIVISIVSTLILLLISSINPIDRSQPLAKEGVIDLTSWDFEKEGSIQLLGDWEFYWDQLLTYEDLHEKDSKSDFNGYQQIPDVWNNYKIKGKHLTGEGYATYRLKVKTNHDQDPLGLKILTMSTSYILMVDNKIVATNGIVGDHKNKSKPEYKTQSVGIMPQSDEFEIIVQVSNFTYARGGIWRPIVLGLDSDIRQLSLEIVRKEMLLVGMMLIMACYHALLYWKRKGDRSLLYVVLGLFVAILRVLVTGEYFITTLIPQMLFSIVIFLEYSTLYWGLTFWVLFAMELFSYEFKRSILRVFVIISMCFTVLTLILPIHIYTNYIIFIEIYLTILLIYAVFKLVVASSNDREDAQAILYCSILLLTAYMIDVSIFLNIIPNFTGGVFTIAVGIAVLIQAYIISRRYSRAMEQSKEREIAMLQAQIEPHFLHNALNALAELSYEGGEKAYDAITSFSEYLRSSYDLFPESKMISLDKELDLVRAYLEVEKLRFGHKLEYQIHVDEQNGIVMPPFLIQPLVENAVRHGVSKKRDGGRITISCKQENKLYKITVEDTGVGISQQVIDSVGAGEKTNEMGHGLSNVNKRIINTYNTRLNIATDEDKGTIVSFYIKTGGKYA